MEAERLIAELIEPVVEVPAYETRTVHVEASNVPVWLLRWILPILAGGLVVFGAIYAAGVVQRHEAERLRHARYARMRGLVRSEVVQNVAWLAEHIAELDRLEQAIQKGRRGVPPAFQVSYPSYLWEAISGEASQFEDIALFAEIGAFYYALSRLEADFRAYSDIALRWSNAAKGISNESLARGRDRARISRIRILDGEFLDAIARLKGALEARRQAGETLLSRLPQR